MPDRKAATEIIEIDVKINGVTRRLSDVSDETLRKMKKLETRRHIKHGDYGYYNDRKPRELRVFLKKGVYGNVSAYCPDGTISQENVNVCNLFDGYVVTGNIFDDLKKDLK